MKITRVEQTPPPLSEQQFDVRLTGLELALIHVLLESVCNGGEIIDNIYNKTKELFGDIDAAVITDEYDTLYIKERGIQTLKEMIDKK